MSSMRIAESKGEGHVVKVKKATSRRRIRRLPRNSGVPRFSAVAGDAGAREYKEETQTKPLGTKVLQTANGGASTR